MASRRRALSRRGKNTNAAALLKRILGPEGERSLEAVRRTFPELARLYVEVPFGRVYSRRGLDVRTRELAAVSALAALGTARPQLKAHLHGAMNVGCTRSQIMEVLLMTMLFAGFPAALNAADAAREVLEERAAIGRKEKRF